MRSTQSALWLTVNGWPQVPDDGSSQCPLMRVVAHSQPLTQEMSAWQQPSAQQAKTSPQHKHGGHASHGIFVAQSARDARTSAA